jgi:hypothetical protein
MARRILLAAALCALALPATVSAHEGNPDYESLLHGVTPPVGGLRVDVLNGDDRLEVDYRGDRTVILEGYDKEPYLRLAPGGVVSVNTRSPALYLNRDRMTGAPVPPSADPGAPPRWRVVSRTGRYEFHDHRIHWMGANRPRQVEDPAERTKVYDWSVPVRAGATRAAITGTLYWRGADDGAPVGAFVALGVLLLLGVVMVVLVRSRRAGAPREEAW